MRVVAHQYDGPFRSCDWAADALAELDLAHLVAWSPSGRQRNLLASELYAYLNLLPDISVCMIHGRSVRRIADLCDQLARLIPGAPLERQLDGTGGLAELLRSADRFAPRPLPRMRVFLWSDADVLLRSDPEAFARVVDTLAGVAAEAELTTADQAWTTHRTLFLGGPPLLDLAQHDGAPFNAWFEESPGEEPFWQMITGLERPQIEARSVDSLLGTSSARSA